MQDDFEVLEKIKTLWKNSPAHLQTYIVVNYPELWEELNKISKR